MVRCSMFAFVVCCALFLVYKLLVFVGWSVGWLIVVCCLLCVVCSWLPVVGWLLFVVCCLLFAVRCALFVACCFRFKVLLVVCCLFDVRWVSFAVCCWLCFCCSLFDAGDKCSFAVVYCLLFVVFLRCVLAVGRWFFDGCSLAVVCCLLLFVG